MVDYVIFYDLLMMISVVIIMCDKLDHTNNQ